MLEEKKKTGDLNAVSDAGSDPSWTRKGHQWGSWLSLNKVYRLDFSFLVLIIMGWVCKKLTFGGAG